MEADILSKYTYNPLTGDIKGPRGKVLLRKDRHGYRYVEYTRGKSTYGHRLAFWLMGVDPTGMQVDHINGDRLDNRWENLRLVTARQNSQNKKVHREGKLLGVYKHSRDYHLTKPYAARLRDKNGIMKHLGMFSTEIEAHKEYLNYIKKEGLK